MKTFRLRCTTVFKVRVRFPKLRAVRVKSVAQLHNPHLMSPLSSLATHTPRQSAVIVIHFTPACTRLLHEASVYPKDKDESTTRLTVLNNSPADVIVAKSDRTKMTLSIISRVILGVSLKTNVLKTAKSRQKTKVLINGLRYERCRFCQHRQL